MKSVVAVVLFSASILLIAFPLWGAAEKKYRVRLAGSQKVKILDRKIDQKFDFRGVLTVKGRDVVLTARAQGQQVTIPGQIQKDLIILVYHNYTRGGVTSVHYICKKEKDGLYKGYVASLIDTRDYVNLGTFTLTGGGL